MYFEDFDMNTIGRRNDQIQNFYINVQNLSHHTLDVKQHHKILEHNLVILGKTWLSDGLTNNSNCPYQINNYSSNFIYLIVTQVQNIPYSDKGDGFYPWEIVNNSTTTIC